MKTYIFRHGRVEAENLTGDEIRTRELNFGELVGVMTPKGYVPVTDRDGDKIGYNGEYHTLREWSEITGINYNTLRTRRYTNKESGDRLFRPVEENKVHRRKADGKSTDSN